jgi:hypothetical protein
VQGTLFDPAFGGLSRCYPTGQGIIPFEARWSPQEWTRVLEPMEFRLVLPQRAAICLQRSMEASAEVTLHPARWSVKPSGMAFTGRQRSRMQLSW